MVWQLDSRAGSPEANPCHHLGDHHAAPVAFQAPSAADPGRRFHFRTFRFSPAWAVFAAVKQLHSVAALAASRLADGNLLSGRQAERAGHEQKRAGRVVNLQPYSLLSFSKGG